MDAWPFAVWVLRLSVQLLVLVTVSASVWADPPPVQPTGAKSAVPVESVDGVSVPGVPREIERAAIEAGAAARREITSVATQPSDASMLEGREGPSSADSSVTLTVAPGTTELVRVARGFLNRVVTPFSDPQLLSVNPIEVKKEGSSLYVATNSLEPVGVHILPNDPSDTRSISLTLIPVRIPPRTIELKWPGGLLGAQFARSDLTAKRWEESAPYESRLYEVLRVVARGEVPEGYALSQPQENLPCVLPGVSFITGQRLTGHQLSVFVLRAQNAGSTPIELESHAGCDLPGVAAVAPWPIAYLQPGAATELYVVVLNDVFEAHTPETLRPSLLRR